MQETADQFIKEFSQSVSEYNLETIETDNLEKTDLIADRFPRSQFLAMGPAMVGVDLIKDLFPVLLVNNTHVNFITSDAPVVLYNYVKLKKRMLVGLQSPGLQICCPLNEKLSLLMFDPKFYEVSSDSDHIILIENTSDIDAINKLQLFNCSHSIVYRDKDELSYIKTLHQSIKKNIEETRLQANFTDTRRLKNDSQSDIIQSTIPSIDYTLKLSFLKLNHKSNKSFKSMAKRKLKDNPYMIFLRDKNVAEIVGKRFKAMNSETQEKLSESELFPGYKLKVVSTFM